MKAGDFGPNGDRVLAFLEQLKGVDLERARALGAAWTAADPDARADAWRTVKAAAGEAGRERALQRVRDEVLRWAATWQGWAWGPFGLEGVPQGLTNADTWAGAAPAAMDAGAALVVGDLLPAEVAEVLRAPWAALVEGRPEG